MNKYKIDIEEMPEIIEANSLNEAVEIAQRNVGVYRVNDEGEIIAEYDYCDTCQKEIDQVDLGGGVYGCPHCKSDSNISIIEV